MYIKGERGSWHTLDAPNWRKFHDSRKKKEKKEPIRCVRIRKKNSRVILDVFFSPSILQQPSEHTKQNTKINIQYESEFSQPSPKLRSVRERECVTREMVAAQLESGR